MTADSELTPPPPSSVEPVHEPTAAGPTLTRDTELPRVLAGPLAPETRRGQRIALSILLVIMFLVAAWIASGLWVGIALGTVMAFTAQPVFRALARRFGERRELAAGLVTTGMGLIAAGLGSLFLYIAVSALLTIGAILERKLQVGSLAAIIGEPASRVVDKIGVSRWSVLARIHAGLEAGAGYAAGSAATVLQAASGALLGLIMALLTMYYVLLEWRTIIVRLERVLPLNPRHTRALILEFRQVGRSVLVGTIATAVVQGSVAGVGYAVLGVAQPLTWGVATGFASFLPILGTGIVWAPVGAYLLLNGQPFAGICVLVWGFLVVATAIDYVVRPRLVGRKVGHPLLVLFALLGGIEVFGLAGLIVAPVLMSLFLAVLRIYERELKDSSAGVHEPK